MSPIVWDTFKYVVWLNLNMPRKKRKKRSENPLLVGLSSLIAILLIASLAFETPIISVVAPSGESVSLSFSLIGLPLLALLMLAILFVRVKK